MLEYRSGSGAGREPAEPSEHSCEAATPAGPGRQEIEAQLSRLLEDSDFRKSRAASQFLRYIVEETLNGRPERLKSYTIATLALGRGNDFDPQISSVVRVQAKRLRTLLNNYYLGRGAEDSVRIELPVGAYQPVFRYAPTASDLEDAHALSQTAIPESNTCLRSPLILVLAIAGIVLLGAEVALRTVPALHDLTFGRPQTEAAIRPLPVLVVEAPVQTSAPSDEIVGVAAAYLESSLSRFDHLVVRAGVDSKQDDEADYSISLASYRKAEAGNAVSYVRFRLVNAKAREVIWSRTMRLDDRAEIREIVNLVAAELGDLAGGAVMADLRQRGPLNQIALRWTCKLDALEYIANNTGAAHDRSRTCTESEFARNGDVHAGILLSWIRLREFVDGYAGDSVAGTLERVGQIAATVAATAAPTDNRSLLTFLNQFYGHDPEEALAMSAQLLESNPNSSLIGASVAVANISRGRYRDGMSLLSRVDTLIGRNLGFTMPYKAVAAYMRGDNAAAERIAFRPTNAPFALDLLMRIVLCAEKGDDSCARASTDKLRRDYPGVAGNIPAALDRHRLSGEIKEKILHSLDRMGDDQWDVEVRPRSRSAWSPGGRAAL